MFNSFHHWRILQCSDLLPLRLVCFVWTAPTPIQNMNKRQQTIWIIGILGGLICLDDVGGRSQGPAERAASKSRPTRRKTRSSLGERFKRRLDVAVAGGFDNDEFLSARVRRGLHIFQLSRCQGPSSSPRASQLRSP
jgi:hypothetical protein